MTENFKIFVVKGVQILAQKTFLLKEHTDLAGAVMLLPVPAIKYVIYSEANLLLNMSPEMVSVVESCCVDHNIEKFEALDQQKMENVFNKMMELQAENIQAKSKSLFPKFMSN